MAKVMSNRVDDRILMTEGAVQGWIILFSRLELEDRSRELVLECWSATFMILITG